nr:MAG TPA_asm: hypothetical protein [Caudoviricetes sp.]
MHYIGIFIYIWNIFLEHFCYLSIQYFYFILFMYF